MEGDYFNSYQLTLTHGLTQLNPVTILGNDGPQRFDMNLIAEYDISLGEGQTI